LTEVPEHLLQRSRERRAALGLGGGDDAAAPAADAPATGAAVEPAAGTAAAPAAAAAPVPAEPAAPAAPEPLPPYVEAAVERKRIPIWAMPVLAFLPLWAFIYVQTLSPPPSTEAGQLETGAEVYASCSSCHGGSGEGGVGRPLNAGEVLLTFPTIESQIEFVAVGSAGYDRVPYGDPDRPGGAHIGNQFGNMPAFAGNLTDAELLAVVRHEREALSGEEVPAEQLGPDGELLHENGNPYIVDDVLVDEEGEPMLGEDGFLAAAAEG
jgi:mono/diheme cytochrome c family protein